MQTETYEIEHIKSTEIEQLAADGESALLIEQLGLTSQRKLIGETTSPFCYPVITKEQWEVFHLLFPQTTALEKYDADLIPLRVLQVAAHAKSTGFLDKGLWVMHPEVITYDPVLIGRTSIPGQTWGERTYLLARWGAALEPFAKLREQAKKLWQTSRTIALKKAELQFALLKNTVEQDAELFFSGKHVETSIYIH